MPQKRNPDVAELARGRAGRLLGNLVALLTALKGLPMTYNRDLQEDKEALFDSIDIIRASLDVFPPMLESAGFDRARIAAAVSDPALLATDLAEHLVRAGVPFRQAHEVVGGLVRLAERRRVTLRELSAEDYRAAHPAFGPDARALLDLAAGLAARTAPGAPSPANVEAELARWRARLA
jgi:argininosuccinate lyase